MNFRDQRIISRLKAVSTRRLSYKYTITTRKTRVLQYDGGMRIGLSDSSTSSSGS